MQSNLAVLTPDNEKSNSEAAASLIAPGLGEEFTNQMRKTQETYWMRPNAQSEIASALPESTAVVENHPGNC